MRAVILQESQLAIVCVCVCVVSITLTNAIFWDMYLFGIRIVRDLSKSTMYF